jgi:hypothetical protein
MADNDSKQGVEVQDTSSAPHSYLQDMYDIADRVKSQVVPDTPAEWIATGALTGLGTHEAYKALGKQMFSPRNIAKSGLNFVKSLNPLGIAHPSNWIKPTNLATTLGGIAAFEAYPTAKQQTLERLNQSTAGKLEQNLPLHPELQEQYVNAPPAEAPFSNLVGGVASDLVGVGQNLVRRLSPMHGYSYTEPSGEVVTIPPLPYKNNAGSNYFNQGGVRQGMRETLVNIRGNKDITPARLTSSYIAPKIQQSPYWEELSKFYADDPYKFNEDLANWYGPTSSRNTAKFRNDVIKAAQAGDQKSQWFVSAVLQNGLTLKEKRLLDAYYLESLRGSVKDKPSKEFKVVPKSNYRGPELPYAPNVGGSTDMSQKVAFLNTGKQSPKPYAGMEIPTDMEWYVDAEDGQPKLRKKKKKKKFPLGKLLSLSMLTASGLAAYGYYKGSMLEREKEEEALKRDKAKARPTISGTYVVPNPEAKQVVTNYKAAPTATTTDTRSRFIPIRERLNPKSKPLKAIISDIVTIFEPHELLETAINNPDAIVNMANDNNSPIGQLNDYLTVQAMQNPEAVRTEMLASNISSKVVNPFIDAIKSGDARLIDRYSKSLLSTVAAEAAKQGAGRVIGNIWTGLTGAR